MKLGMPTAGHQPADEDADGSAEGDGEEQREQDVLVLAGEGDDDADDDQDRAADRLQVDAQHGHRDHRADDRPVEQTGDAVMQPAGEDGLGGEAGADTAGRAGRQVDLAEQQHEDQAQRDDRDVRALPGQVADVVAARNRLLTWEKMTPSTMRPSTDGSAPGSPERRRLK